MASLKKLLGIAPKPEADGTLSPSPLALKLATQSKSNYDGRNYEDAIKDGQYRVLVI